MHHAKFDSHHGFWRGPGVRFKSFTAPIELRRNRVERTGMADRMNLKHAKSGLLLAGAALVALSGCSQGDLGHTMGSWQGSHVDDVMLAWGQPVNCGSFDGRRICSWQDTSVGMTATRTTSCERSLEIDPDGYVTGWRWRGDYCHATADRVMARAEFRRPDALAAELLEGENPGVSATVSGSDGAAAEPE